MFKYLLFPKTIGGAFRRLSILLLILCAGCARNMWMLSGEPNDPAGLPYVRSYSFDLIALGYEMASWPYIIGLFVAAVLSGLAARFMDMVQFGVEETREPEAIAHKPTIH